MNLPHFFARPQPVSPHQDAVLQDIVTLLLETDERRFSQLLLARLLDEGCNLPLKLAKPRLYMLMASALSKHLPFDKFAEIPEILEDHSTSFQHARFVEIMTFYYTHLSHAKQTMAFEFLNALDVIKAEWQEEAHLCQEKESMFGQRLQVIVESLFPQSLSDNDVFSLPQVRRRLYLAMTTSLLRHLRDRSLFQSTFGSIPQALSAMQQNHAEFVRFLLFCRERIPYYDHIAAQIFWRALETVCLEMYSRAQKVPQDASPTG